MIAGRSLSGGSAAFAAPPSPGCRWLQGGTLRSPVGAWIAPTVVLAALRAPIVTFPVSA